MFVWHEPCLKQWAHLVFRKQGKQFYISQGWCLLLLLSKILSEAIQLEAVLHQAQNVILIGRGLLSSLNFLILRISCCIILFFHTLCFCSWSLSWLCAWHLEGVEENSRLKKEPNPLNNPHTGFVWGAWTNLSFTFMQMNVLSLDMIRHGRTQAPNSFTVAFNIIFFECKKSKRYQCSLRP